MESKRRKVAIYGVCKNEEYNIDKWHEHAKNADYLFLLDTGSTDNTIQKAKDLGINILSASIIPWSETIAKNTALSLLPTGIDVCICLDLDQIIVTKNWKAILDSLEEVPTIGNVFYKSQTGYKDETRTNWHPLIHSRNNVYWLKYRPRPTNVVDFGKEKVNVNIEVLHMPGNDDRFEDREPLYIDTYLREHEILLEYASLDYQFDVVGGLALSFFEIGNIEKFIEYFDKFMIIYNQYISNKKDFENNELFPVDRLLGQLFLSKSLCLPEKAEDLLLSSLDNKHIINPEEIDRMIMKLAIIYFIKSDKDLSKYYIGLLNNTEYVEDICEILITKNNLLDLSEAELKKIKIYYGTTGFGKWHPELSQESLDYFMRQANG